ncbi:MAG TPA: hypothetical protein VK016_03395 [Arenimonas sp.]|jgi:hypothetical protein|nr:hypothetical protein [Arenimonas sp.]
MSTLKSIHARVVAAQESPDAIPLTLRPGDAVHVRHAHPDRPGYVWVEDGQLSSGWVPMDLIDTNAGRPQARAEYCSAELSVQPGDRVRLIWEDPAHGACWCEDRHSERGWVRNACLQFEEAEG